MKYLLFTFLFLFPSFLFAADAASLSLFPAVGTHQIGDTFTVSVNVDTGSQTINAVEGKIAFNTEELAFESLSKDASVLESWATEPSYSDSDGTISFGGGMKTFIGNSGKLFSITFRALKNADAQVRFSTGAAILAADGQGTNILTVMNAGAYTLAAKEVIPAAEHPTEGLVLGAASSTVPKISVASASHSDENKWYAEKTAKFSWTLPPETSNIRLSLNQSSSSIPTKPYPPISEKTIQDLDEGVSYFHIQAKTSFGWGEPVAYRLQVDTLKPETFAITSASERDTFAFVFDAKDKTSGIEKYLIQIDGGTEMEWKDDGSHTYVPPENQPGAHTLAVKAVDFAGNMATSSFVYTLVSVNPPTITDFEHELTPGNALVVRGKADPNTTISVRVSKDAARTEEDTITSGSDGSFTFVLGRKTEEGTYKIYAEQLGRGVRSAPSESVIITVSQPKILLFGKMALSYLSILIPLATLALLLIFILVFGWHRFKIFRMTLRKEVEEVEAVSRESFKELRNEMHEDERILDSISASPKKRKEAVERIKKTIDIAEEKVEKEIVIAKEKAKKSTRLKIKKMD